MMHTEGPLKPTGPDAPDTLSFEKSNPTPLPDAGSPAEVRQPSFFERNFSSVRKLVANYKSWRVEKTQRDLKGCKLEAAVANQQSTLATTEKALLDEGVKAIPNEDAIKSLESKRAFQILVIDMLQDQQKLNTKNPSHQVQLHYEETLHALKTLVNDNELLSRQFHNLNTLLPDSSTEPEIDAVANWSERSSQSSVEEQDATNSYWDLTDLLYPESKESTEPLAETTSKRSWRTLVPSDRDRILAGKIPEISLFKKKFINRIADYRTSDQEKVHTRTEAKMRLFNERLVDAMNNERTAHLNFLIAKASDKPAFGESEAKRKWLTILMQIKTAYGLQEQIAKATREVDQLDREALRKQLAAIPIQELIDSVKELIKMESKQQLKTTAAHLQFLLPADETAEERELQRNLLHEAIQAEANAVYEASE